MINVILFQKNNKIIGFEIKNHGKDIVCSAISMLSLNTVNSIEALTNAKFNIEYDSNGGFLKFLLNLNPPSEEANLLLQSLELGIKGVKLEYPKEISVIYKEVQSND